MTRGRRNGRLVRRQRDREHRRRSKAAVEAAGYEAGQGFIKLPYDRDLPTELLKSLLRARVEEYAATGAGWNDR